MRANMSFLSESNNQQIRLLPFSMTTHETANKRYGELQAILRDRFQAEGRGLIEMVRSIEAQLPPTLVWELRSIGHIRNKVVHDGLERIPRYFDPLCIEASASLKQLIAQNLPEPENATKSIRKKTKTPTSKPTEKAAKKSISTRSASAKRKRATNKPRSK